MERAAQLPVIATSAWERGPAHPSLAVGVVDVWQADLRSVDDAVLRWLSADERERAARILNRSKGILWTRSRGVLRELLGRYTGVSPDAIALAPGPGGKPELKAGQGADLQFNLSHSAWLALFAFSGDGLVGVDVERTRAHLDELALAARAFGGASARALEALPPSSRQREFLRSWARYEAAGKCLGEGICLAGAAADSRPIWRWPAAREVWVGDLDVGSGAAAALAARWRPAAVRCFAWRG